MGAGGFVGLREGAWCKTASACGRFGIRPAGSIGAPGPPGFLAHRARWPPGAPVRRRVSRSDPSGRLARMAHWRVWRVDPAGLPGPPHPAACCAAGRDSACRTPTRLMPVARQRRVPRAGTAAVKCLAQPHTGSSSPPATGRAGPPGTSCRPSPATRRLPPCCPARRAPPGPVGSPPAASRRPLSTARRRPTGSRIGRGCAGYPRSARCARRCWGRGRLPVPHRRCPQAR